MEPKAAQPRHSEAATAQPLIGKGWVQGVALVMIFGFLVMGAGPPGRPQATGDGTRSRGRAGTPRSEVLQDIASAVNDRR
ncbi:hypothetical protein [Mycobacterium haemophilum]|uniref:Uncharacterized protein n=1 Tax=Mycobacterium haemophilum TaxID=29311 RepID=A0A0I9UQL8_9MYCO|nr:hypothetical protein [Mycobacterium haemophilum]KLO33483.1 hypothetical protein ABH39_01155 [Mycobacterium haemophilum]KLO39008.1 hypothetical protein ABH38_01160 [Mycobacterium haemophilum]KLO45424.1 hypothetical protein ABH37_01160 [Mycobacterium haemophilum]KLO56574.1 hypothetical protein ABH36_01155 [Mycobacterium haemophilum]